MALITERYASEIAGVLTCYDRMIIQGYIAPWSHADGMTSYLSCRKESTRKIFTKFWIFWQRDTAR